ncbi:hypothetical protein VTK26DRAFT_5190 [Humicola hyalothermophila]
MSSGSRVSSGGRQLRHSSMLRRPGRYQEDDGPITADKPLFVHEDVPYNPNLARHCAFPSLPLDYPGRGPAELEREREKAMIAVEAAALKERKNDVSYTDEDEDGQLVSSNGKPVDSQWRAPSRRWHNILTAREEVEQMQAQQADQPQEDNMFATRELLPEGRRHAFVVAINRPISVQGSMENNKESAPGNKSGNHDESQTSSIASRVRPCLIPNSNTTLTG